MTCDIFRVKLVRDRKLEQDLLCYSGHVCHHGGTLSQDAKVKVVQRNSRARKMAQNDNSMIPEASSKSLIILSYLRCF